MDEPMTQFRAIPIHWGLSTDPYHKFLMWVSFRATFNGWGRCDALQVTFTLREVEAELGIKKTTTSRYVSRAQEEGLLSPTNSYSREVGKGEVYDLGGEMLMTVKSVGQAWDNSGTSVGQADSENTTTCLPASDKVGTSVGQARDAYRSTPDTPDTPTKKKRVSRENKIAHLDGYPEAALTTVRALLPIWPNMRGDSAIEFNPDLAASRVTEILSANPTITAEVLISAATRYLKQMRDSNSSKYISALHFFFGPGKGSDTPKWALQVRAVNHERVMEKINAK